MKRCRICVPILGLLLSLPASGIAAGFTWQDHAKPFDFLFGNHIDTHQQTKRQKDGSLKGSFYVVQLDADGDGVPDTTADGNPIMGHCTKPADDASCQAGWTLTAAPCIPEVNGCSAMFLYAQDDHPVWLVGPRMREKDGQSFLGGSRRLIPQPGYATHFHWLTSPGGIDANGVQMASSVGQLETLFGVHIAVPDACNVVEATQLAAGTICPGYFLQLQAVAVSNVYRQQSGPQWAFHHGGEDIVLRPGPDIASHTNIVTSYVADDSIGAGGLSAQ